MRIEYALTVGDPKSVALSDIQIKNTGTHHLSPSDIMMALGLTQSRQGLGLHLLHAKYKKDPAEREKALKLMLPIAHQHAPKALGKIAGRYTARAIELIVALAIEDYSRTADTPGAKCRCGGRGKVYDLTATRELGHPVEKACQRCHGLGINRLPASKAYRVVTTLVPELTQQNWSRNWKPFYERLIQRCYQEESNAIQCYNDLTETG